MPSLRRHVDRQGVRKWERDREGGIRSSGHVLVARFGETDAFGVAFGGRDRSSRRHQRHERLDASRRGNWKRRCAWDGYNEWRSGSGRSCARIVSRLKFYRETPNRYWRRRKIGADRQGYSNPRKLESRPEQRGISRRIAADPTKARAGRGIPMLGFLPPVRGYPSPGARVAEGSRRLEQTCQSSSAQTHSKDSRTTIPWARSPSEPPTFIVRFTKGDETSAAPSV
jgi:hypothetical protein